MLENAKGMKDVFPEDKIIKDKIIRRIKDVFELYGYSPLETPTVERFDILTSKYAGGIEIRLDSAICKIYWNESKSENAVQKISDRKGLARRSDGKQQVQGILAV